MNYRALFAALFVTTALANPALAADIPVRGPAPPPPAIAPAYLEEWSGIYVGLEAGYGWGRQEVDSVSIGGFGSPVDSLLSGGGTTVISETNNGITNSLVVAPVLPGFMPGIGSISQRGGIFGGFAGAQKQLGNWVLGLEVDFDGTSIQGSAVSSSVATGTVTFLETSRQSNGVITFTFPPTGITVPGTVTQSLAIDTKIDELGSARGKVGFTLAPNWLIYGTGGLAFAHDTKDVVATQTATTTQPIFGSSFTGSAQTLIGSGGATMLGFAVGAGFDWKLPGSGWIFGVEYLHYEFPKHTIALNDSSGSIGVVDTREKVDAIKGRISYLFPIH